MPTILPPGIFSRELERRRLLAIDRKAAEGDLMAFIRMFWHTVEPEAQLVEGWPLEAMCDSLMAVTEGHITRLLINIFPGAMKSLTLNVFWPAWEWIHFPSMRYISTSYSATLTERDNGRLLRIVSSRLYQQCWPHVRITKAGVSKIENSATGWKVASSVGGTTTGQRGNRVLIDDANDPAQVESATVRDGTNQWLREVMPDRLNNLSEDAIISIQQRTHRQDATGTLVKYGGDRYTWLCIPMEFDPLRISSVVLRRDDKGQPTDVWTDPRALDRDGEVLEGLYFNDKGNGYIRHGSPLAKVDGKLAWPERFSEDAVDEQRNIKGTYAYAGQYQQAPTPRGGGIINVDWWNTWTKRNFPDFGTTIGSFDTAMEENTEADWNAFTGWGAFPGDAGQPQLMLMDAWRIRAPLAELVARIAETCAARRIDYLLIEHKTRGRDVHDEIKRLYQHASWQTVLVKPLGDKQSRLNAVSHLFSGDCRRDPVSKLDVYTNGMIFAPATAWADEVIAEVSDFPRGAHDDYVDSVSMCLSWVRKHGVVLRKMEFDAQEEEARRFKRRQGVPYAITAER
jgi:predicted phage terminase large subunit-like protein